jgi:hypothetical protein
VSATAAVKARGHPYQGPVHIQLQCIRDRGKDTFASMIAFSVKSVSVFVGKFTCRFRKLFDL